MAQEPAVQPETEWYTDDMDNETMLADDDFDFEEGPETDEEIEEIEPAGDVPVWRLIEMSRENRSLARELADFDDYDIMDGSGSIDSYQSEYAH